MKPTHTLQTLALALALSPGLLAAAQPKTEERYTVRYTAEPAFDDPLYSRGEYPGGPRVVVRHPYDDVPYDARGPRAGPPLAARHPGDPYDDPAFFDARVPPPFAARHPDDPAFFDARGPPPFAARHPDYAGPAAFDDPYPYAARDVRIPYGRAPQRPADFDFDGPPLARGAPPPAFMRRTVLDEPPYDARDAYPPIRRRDAVVPPELALMDLREQRAGAAHALWVTLEAQLPLRAQHDRAEELRESRPKFQRAHFDAEVQAAWAPLEDNLKRELELRAKLKELDDEILKEEGRRVKAMRAA